MRAPLVYAVLASTLAITVTVGSTARADDDALPEGVTETHQVSRATPPDTSVATPALAGATDASDPGAAPVDPNPVMDTIDAVTGRGRPTGWSPDHPVAVGTRAAGWLGEYNAPGLGGQIKIRPVEEVGLSLYNDNFIRPQDDALRRDHVIGFSVYAPSLIGNERHFIAPELGACVDFRYVNPLDDRPSVSDVLFGAHLGVMAEVWVFKGLSLEMNANVTEYVGHDTGLARWSARVSRELTVSTVGQVTASANYYF
jgi:hypothetical protein